MQTSTSDQTFKLNLFNRWANTYDWLLPSVFYQAVHQRLLEFVSLPPAAHVLDLGCGTGKLLNRLATEYPQLTGVGFDFAAKMLAQAAQKSADSTRLSYAQGTSSDLPFPDAQFDAVFCTISFLHYPDPAAVLSEVHRVLKPGGSFYLADYAPSLCSGQETVTVAIAAGSVQFYSKIARDRLGETAGLRIDRQVHLLGPILLSIFVKPA
ncbi:MAG: class I SAM-dependent methyltransferase [Leptolyngbya sp. SIO4C1]|nr:class I SAM-dependent methyltransferase [Leptolyngbya sp. SIO4C1]